MFRGRILARLEQHRTYKYGLRKILPLRMQGVQHLYTMRRRPYLVIVPWITALFEQQRRVKLLKRNRFPSDQHFGLAGVVELFEACVTSSSSKSSS